MGCCCEVKIERERGLEREKSREGKERGRGDLSRVALVPTAKGVGVKNFNSMPY